MGGGRQAIRSDPLAAPRSDYQLAGGEIPLGIFADYTSDDDQLLNSVEQVITARLTKELNLSDEIVESEPTCTERTS